MVNNRSKFENLACPKCDEEGNELTTVKISDSGTRIELICHKCKNYSSASFKVRNIISDKKRAPFKKYRRGIERSLYNFMCPICNIYKLHPTKTTWNALEFVCNGCKSYTTASYEMYKILNSQTDKKFKPFLSKAELLIEKISCSKGSKDYHNLKIKPNFSANGDKVIKLILECGQCTQKFVVNDLKEIE